ncbi:OsmC family protein [Leptospira sp. 2 VSF19]|uniref:OsmC family protein n=1 Tax=Leptospira soteropolitanensis TaxID=2950025 RepID=A0AAW5VQ12_9LEPT|nr:OsmC family protein [Leptospira soteropolitanensis]MCW7494006.1 OsmC family protein [Leptospira soteropolitanensis]MCW7501728.1 OsmC family protein [Leptospira soteropolitanensis]MCW7523852.1 OsmC family protein [Leptospira soteropolitanensis]MCW7527717.1 OsmC family protein [Leptospira soteropolitanensis]MCW7531698.1 OsmC family protein [Leptospira soteropolitanensis]
MTNLDQIAKSKMEFHVETLRVDSHTSLSRCKSAEIILDTDMAGNPNAFNPAELLLSALSACIIKGVERVSPILHFQWKGIQVIVDGIRQDVPPKMESIRYQVIVDTEESEERLHLLHENIKKYGTVFNTIAPGTHLVGEIRRK